MDGKKTIPQFFPWQRRSTSTAAQPSTCTSTLQLSPFDIVQRYHIALTQQLQLPSTHLTPLAESSIDLSSSRTADVATQSNCPPFSIEYR